MSRGNAVAVIVGVRRGLGVNVGPRVDVGGRVAIRVGVDEGVFVGVGSSGVAVGAIVAVGVGAGVGTGVAQPAQRISVMTISCERIGLSISSVQSCVNLCYTCA